MKTSLHHIVLAALASTAALGGALAQSTAPDIDLEAIRSAGVRIGADPMGGASVQYWQYIAEHLGLDLTVINPTVDPR